MKKALLFFTVCLGVLVSTNAQENTTDQKDTTIKGQFEELIRKSGNYRQDGRRYEVVRLIELNALQQSISDSVGTANKTIGELKATIAENETALSSLNAKLSETTTNLNQLTQEKDSMSFFGAMVSKGTYKLIVWGIIFALLISLVLFIYKFRNSNYLTKQAKLALNDLEEEFEQHRRRALEREQKVSRQLQDELNKNKKGA
ncbi:MAG: tRNA (guanine-N1)-methyltransferase [Flavobacteriaceae bacterium]|uniref:tRNA (guanine-N1)-methyltransferase n=1 Tax=Flagellimonas algarum TaxID=3230298 RepID=UPI0033954057|nr:tRNA (guanine-N1)-methyltransferase [Flavobacteriaceae bacterium]